MARSERDAISCAELLEYLSLSPRGPRTPFDDPDWQRDRLERLLVERALETAAVNTGIPGTEAVRNRWEATRSSVLVSALERDLEASIELDADAARRHYVANREQFDTPEKISTRVILLHLQPDASPSEVAAADVRLRTIRQEFLDGTPFGALARRHSEAENAARGGAVAASARGTLLPQFEDVAWSLEPGQVSEVVRLPDALALILTERRFPPRDWSFEEVEGMITKRLQREELDRLREQVLARARKRWPVTPHRQPVADPSITDREPLLSIADRSFSLSDLGLDHRPPRLREAVEAAVESRLLCLWAEDRGFGRRPAVKARLAHQRRTLMAAVELDRRVSARLPEVPESELEALYSESTSTLATPRRRSFDAVVVTGEPSSMRSALATAQQVAAEWQRTGDVPAGRHIERWGPLRQVDLSAATSPLLARAAFELAEDRVSTPILLERYSVGSARFQPEGYVVLRLDREIPLQVPPLDAVRDRLTRKLLGAQVAAISKQVRDELLDSLGFSVDADALARCARSS